MKVLVTGAGGQLGKELQRTVPDGIHLIARTRAEFDIGEEAAVRSLLSDVRPDVLINAAAYTAVDKAETDANAAYAANETGPRALAKAAKAVGAHLVHVSTDFVFDGKSSVAYRPDAVPNPLNVYGASKLAGEIAVRETLETALIIRTGWVYSAFGANFVKTILRLASTRDRLTVVVDQIGTPTWANSLARAVWRGALDRQSGTLHWSDAGVASWFDFAVAILEEARAAGLLAKEAEIKPIDTSEYPTPAPRPKFSVLDKRESWRTLRLQPDHWRVALRQMLTEMKRHADG